jgi:hypothetical protein
MAYLTVPLPVPLLPEVIFAQALLLLAVHLQVEGLAVTVLNAITQTLHSRKTRQSYNLL